MSGVLDSYGGPTTVGIVLGLIVLLSFGGLTALVWDDRLNGTNATALVELLQEQEQEIQVLKNQKAWKEEELLKQDQRKLMTKEIASLEKMASSLVLKKEQLQKGIEEEEAHLEELKKEKLEYRDVYRVYERKRAAGEKYKSIALKNGKELKNVEITKVYPDRVSFSTEFGSSSKTWEMLPDEWGERFQVGEGELEVYNAMSERVRSERVKQIKSLAEARQKEQEAHHLNRRLKTVIREIKSLELDVENAKGSIKRHSAKIDEYRRRGQIAREKGNLTSYKVVIQNSESVVSRLSGGLNRANQKLSDLRTEKAQLERKASQQ